MATRGKLANLRARLSKMREKGQETVAQVMQTAEIGGASFGLAYVRGRNADAEGDLDVFGVPASLLVAATAHVLGFAGVAGKFDEHLHNVGDGALAEYAAFVGSKMGSQAANGYQSLGSRPHSLRGGLPPGAGWGQTVNPAAMYSGLA